MDLSEHFDVDKHRLRGRNARKEERANVDDHCRAAVRDIHASPQSQY
jgi:hypothetical protein